MPEKNETETNASESKEPKVTGSETKVPIQATQLEPAKAIHCMLPDDGTDLQLMRLLKNEKGITRVESIACRGVQRMQQTKTRAGKLPEPSFFRFLTVIVNESQVDDIFHFIYQKARIGEPGRGVLIQATILGATAYSIPDDVPDEATQHSII